MKVLVVLMAVVGSCLGGPQLGYGAVGPLGYGGLLGPHYGVPFLPALRSVAVAAAPVLPAHIKTQYHAQDELGQASYGHTEPFQAHHAIQDAAGNKIGSYSYLNPSDGQVHRTDYVADGLGYRVAANDLPAAPLVQPLPAVDTPEVVAARAAHLAAHVRARRALLLGQTPAATAPLAYSAPVVAAPAPLAYAAPAPLAYSAPVLRDATLTTIVNTPGHAVSYRVD